MAGRADWEVNSFFITWGLSVLHAMVRRGRAAWVDQLVLAALLFCAVPLLNAMTTPYHLGATLILGDWAMAGFDLTCLGSGVFLAWAAWKMQRSGQTERVPRKQRAQSIALDRGPY